jgi:DNA-binding response OmpR family regulator
MTTGLNIVVVEDHDILREILVDLLCQNGHRASGFFCAEDVDDEQKHALTDLYVIDLNLPGEDGLSLARRIRHAHPRVGIVMATARSSLSDKMTGYDSGADFYLSKPVDPEELLAVITAFARRTRQDQEKQVDILRLNGQRMTLTGPLGKVMLTQSEILMLSSLMIAPGQVLERWQIIANLVGEADTISDSSLEVRMTYLRRKIAEVGGDTPAIKAVRKYGYKLIVPILMD